MAIDFKLTLVTLNYGLHSHHLKCYSRPLAACGAIDIVIMLKKRKKQLTILRLKQLAIDEKIIPEVLLTFIVNTFLNLQMLTKKNFQKLQHSLLKNIVQLPPH